MQASLFFSAVLAAALLSACNEQKPIRETNAPVSAATQAVLDSASAAGSGHAAPDSTTAGSTVSASYGCPMGCAGSAGPKPGNCPTCGMALVKKS